MNDCDVLGPASLILPRLHNQPNTEKVVVHGRGMEPILYDQDEVLLDTSKRMPRNGDVVVVRIGNRDAIGKWRNRNDRVVLTLPNAPTLDLFDVSGWEVVGTITTIIGRAIRGRR